MESKSVITWSWPVTDVAGVGWASTLLDYVGTNKYYKTEPQYEYFLLLGFIIKYS